MKLKTEKICVALLLGVLFVFPIAQISFGNAAETTSPETVLSFLKDVVTLDITEYNVTLVGNSVAYWGDLGGLPQMTGKYALSSETSKIDVLYTFINNTLCGCLLDLREGTLQYVQPLPQKISEVAGGFIQRYQTFAGDSDTQMSSMLDNLDATKNITKTSDNIKLEVTAASLSTSFAWRTMFNNATYTGVQVSFNNGDFRSFSDDRSYYRMGNTEINVSEADALGIALNRAASFSYSYGGNTISDFTIANDYVTAELFTKSKDKPLELYPYWMIKLPLGDVYPGSITMIVVEVWADTSEVIRVYPLGVGGDLSPSPSSSPQLSPTLQPSVTPTVSPSTLPEPTSSLSPQSPEPTVSPSPTSLLPSLQPSGSVSPQPTNNPTPAITTTPLATITTIAAVAAATIIIVSVAIFLKRKAK